MTYYLIVTYEGEAWAPQFGDKDKECVQQERLDTYVKQRGYSYEGDGKVIAKHCRVIKFPRVPTQRQITERLEGEPKPKD